MIRITSNPFVTTSVSLLIAIASMSLAGCASTPGEPDAEMSNAIALPSTVTFEFERGPVGVAFREISRASSISVVLMKGLELAQTGPHSFLDRPPESIIRKISKGLGYKLHQAPQYLFVFAPGYEALLEVDVEGLLSDETSGLRAEVAFGAGTPLYSGLGLLGYTLGHTFVADNAVAGALCGELHLRDVSISSALTAMLQSARMSEGSFRIESTADYVFLFSAANVSGPRFSGDRAALTTAQQSMLRRRVSLMLPAREENPGHIQGHRGASTLGEVLPELSAQLGITVTADRIMHRLPLNPMVISDTPIETAMDLIIRQWLIPEFFFEVDGTGIRLRHVRAAR